MSDEIKMRHIVVVDDEPVNLELVENALTGQYKLTKLISGAQLMTFLSRVKPDMILLDVQMPGLNGYEVISKINENPDTKDIPVIFLTGQDSLASEKKCLTLGAKDFIRKPFDAEVMSARIRSQMELHIYRSELEDVIVEKTHEIETLQHLLTVSLAEMIESRDGTTGCHVRNTMAYFSMLIKELVRHPLYAKVFASHTLVDDLVRAASLHDIGKVAISDVILKKKGSLDPKEFSEMELHSKIGAEMIEKIIADYPVNSFLTYAKEMAWSHHERWNGEGYPRGLKGEEIPLYVRVLSIADVYDALTSVRPYKRAFTHEEAMEVITKETGSFFDPDIYKVMLSIEKDIKAYEKESY